MLSAMLNAVVSLKSLLGIATTTVLLLENDLQVIKSFLFITIYFPFLQPVAEGPAPRKALPNSKRDEERVQENRLCPKASFTPETASVWEPAPFHAPHWPALSGLNPYHQVPLTASRGFISLQYPVTIPMQEALSACPEEGCSGEAKGQCPYFEDCHDDQTTSTCSSHFSAPPPQQRPFII